jgi:hypothetical protein
MAAVRSRAAASPRGGEVAMDLQDEILDVSRDQRIAANLVKHIRKLR